jgi:hypothetical protein
MGKDEAKQREQLKWNTSSSHPSRGRVSHSSDDYFDKARLDFTLYDTFRSPSDQELSTEHPSWIQQRRCVLSTRKR